MSLHQVLRNKLKIIFLVLFNLVLSIAIPRAFAQTKSEIILNAKQIEQAGIAIQAVTKAVSTEKNSGDAATENGQKLSGNVVLAMNASQILSSPVSGYVQELLVQPFQNIKVGMPVAVVYSQQLLEIQRDYIQVKTQLSLAHQKLQREEGLFVDGIISQNRLQETKAQVIQLEVSESEKSLTLLASGISDKTLKEILRSKNLQPKITLYSKYAGAITEISLSNGQRLEPGMPLLKVATPSNLNIEFRATQAQATTIKVGDFISIKNCGKVVVQAISPQTDLSSQQVTIRAREVAGKRKQECLTPNQFVEGIHETRVVPEAAFGVDPSAIFQQGKRAFVFERTKRGFLVVPVEIVGTSGDLVWIVGKLHSGSEVASRGVASLKGAWLGLGSEGVVNNESVKAQGAK